MQRVQVDFTLVTTVFNEAGRLGQTLADLDAQTLAPTQVCVVDAGSTDGTVALLEAWAATRPYPVRLESRPGCNIAQGRNHAIALASHELIVSTDFGCRYHAGWLASLVEPFAVDATVEVVAGAFTILHEEVRTAAARADYILQAGYPVDMGPYFSGSSRSIAYKKSVWQAIGGYQEWLTLAADDTVFWRQIKLAGYKYMLVDKPYVYWLRHSTYRAFAREAYRYGLGDGEAGINYRNFWSVVAESGMRLFSILATLIFVLVSISRFAFRSVSGEQYLVISLILIPANALARRFGFRPYKRARVAMDNLRYLTSEPGFTGPKDLSHKELKNAYYLIELSRIDYIRGYIKGRWGRPDLAAARTKLGHLPV